MTKKDIVESVYERLGGFSKKEAAGFVETVLDLVKDALVSEGHLKIASFGSFGVRAKRQRTGRNPVTGEPLQIRARRVMWFKPSPVLRTILNS